VLYYQVSDFQCDSLNGNPAFAELHRCVCAIEVLAQDSERVSSVCRGGLLCYVCSVWCGCVGCALCAAAAAAGWRGCHYLGVRYVAGWVLCYAYSLCVVSAQLHIGCVGGWLRGYSAAVRSVRGSAVRCVLLCEVCGLLIRDFEH
jgi:hypothetical protein